MRRCAACGRAVNDDVTSCPNCGRAIDLTQAPEAAPPPAAPTPGAMPPPAAMPAAPAQGYTPPTYSSLPAPGQAVYIQPAANGKAITSLILSIVGLLCCVLLGIAGVVLGFQAKREIRDSNGQQTGDGMAMAGIVIGFISIAFSSLLFVVYAIGAVAESA